MEIEFDELMVGEKGRAHDVLASTLPEDIARSLAHRLDLPGQLPPGFALDNFVSGFPHGALYVLARTSIDHQAERHGMVFSHALVADRAAIGNLQRIEHVLERLASRRPSRLSATRILLPSSHDSAEGQPSPAICDALARSALRPIVVPAPSALEDVVTSLWPKLPPSLRRELQFRLSFGPEETDVTKVHIVAAPQSTVTRWLGAQIVDAHRLHGEPETAAGRFLSGGTEGTLITFLTDLDIECTTFETLELAGRALELLEQEKTFHSTLTAARIVASLQPDPTKGVSPKNILSRRLTTDGRPRNVQDFLVLRNLSLAPFPNAATIVQGLSAQLSRLFEECANPKDLLPIALSAYDRAKATEHWCTAFQSALDQLSSAGLSNFSRLVWTALSEEQELGGLLLERASSLPSMDERMASTLSTTYHKGLLGAANELITVGFNESETQLLILSCNSIHAEALKVACERDRQLYGDAAIKRILQIMSPEETVSAALEIADVSVISAAADKVAENSALLAKRPICDEKVQRIWLAAIRKDPRAWAIRADVDALREEVFDSIIDGQIAGALVDLLMSSPLGDALKYRRRTALWEALPKLCREKALERTAESWVDSLPQQASQADFLSPEIPLAGALASPNLKVKLTTALKLLSFEDAINVIAGNPHLTEDHVAEILVAHCNPASRVSPVALKQAGQVIASRNWRGVTRALFSRYGITDDLRDVFHICAGHLTPWERLLYGISRPSSEDLHKLLVETACTLYPTGPAEGEIWIRAGGELWQLDLSGTGREQWEVAIRKVRYGYKLRPGDLIARMLEDFPLNKALQYLSREHQ